MMFRVALAALLFLSGYVVARLDAQEPGWRYSFLSGGAEAQQIRQQDILDRPYRPGHFYGNAVRRMHYRGRLLPRPRDFSGARGGWFRRQ